MEEVSTWSFILKCELSLVNYISLLSVATLFNYIIFLMRKKLTLQLILNRWFDGREKLPHIWGRGGGQPRGDTQCSRSGVATRGVTLCPGSGAATGRRYPTPLSPRPGAAGGRSYPRPEARGGGPEDQPHAVAVRAQEGLEELSYVEGQEGRWWGDTPHPR